MSPKPLSWQSALSASVVIHALLVGGIGLIFFQSAPVGGSGMLTVDLGGPAGNAGGLGDMHQDGRLGNGGAGGDGAKSHSKDRRLEPTDEPEKPLAPKQKERHWTSLRKPLPLRLHWIRSPLPKRLS